MSSINRSILAASLVTGAALLFVCTQLPSDFGVLKRNDSVTPDVPAAPVISSVDSLHLPFPTVNWEPVNEATGYILLRSIIIEGPYEALDTITEVAFTDRSIVSDQTYYYRVAASNSLGQSPQSQPDSFTTDYFLVTAPDARDVFAVGDTVTISMSTTMPISCGLNLFIGEISFQVPNNLGFSGTFIPASHPEVSFIIPAYFTKGHWDDALQAVVLDTTWTVSDSCYIELYNYGTGEMLTESERFFTIQ